MHWHILGAGSIGCLWGHHLRQAGHQVTLILRNTQKLTNFAGSIQLEQDGKIQAAQVSAELATAATPIDYLLVTTKAYDITAALASVAHRFHEDTHLVLLHNGMGPQQQAYQDYPNQHVWAASTTDGVWLKSAFQPVFAGQGQTLIGSLQVGRPNLLSEQLQTLALKVQADPAIENSLWRKLAINCAINPLTARYNCRNGELLDGAERQQMMTAVCQEIEQLCQHIDQPLFDQPLIDAAYQVARNTADNYSSMHQDVAHKRRTEIEQINGYICQIASNQGVSVPVNQQLLTEILHI